MVLQDAAAVMEEEDHQSRCSGVAAGSMSGNDDTENVAPTTSSMESFGSGARAGRRPTIFTIAENYEFDDEEFQRKVSTCLSTYSSNSSLGM